MEIFTSTETIVIHGIILDLTTNNKILFSLNKILNKQIITKKITINITRTLKRPILFCFLFVCFLGRGAFYAYNEFDIKVLKKYETFLIKWDLCLEFLKN